ncbi:MAG: hypothetical protein JEZ01_20940 [Labilibaculum sp.]|nr:hypothetical protein [Labilibaculum sp.]MBI9060246.1 hypothetical protein [Labilibaculum sp.]
MKKQYLSVILLIIAILGIVCIKISILQKSAYKSKPIFLRKSLSELDEKKLLPYKVMLKHDIPEDMLAVLGTEEYIHWTLEDTELPIDESGRYISLFVTFYSNYPERPPQVAEVTYSVAGNKILRVRNSTITVPNWNQFESSTQIPVREITVELADRITTIDNQIITYFFVSNGEYYCDRKEVRYPRGRKDSRYGYLSKVEFSFRDSKEMVSEQSLERVEKLCRVLIPILRSEHWPDLEKAGNQ